MPRGAKPKVYPLRIVQQVAQMYESGSTQGEIAAALGMTQKIVFNLMRRHGLKARIAAKRDQKGDRNASWKGDGAGKQAFHRRLYALYGKPACCLVCGTTNAKAYDYANISGRYEDLDDYMPLCRSCHSKYDGKVDNITTNRRDADGQA